MSTSPISRQSAKRLEKLAGLGDAEADTLLVGLAGRITPPPGVDAEDRSARLRQVLAEIGKDIEDETIDEEVRDFLLAGSKDLDDFISRNLDRIQRAQNYFDDNGVAIITALFHGSLPEAYLGKRGVQVLDATGELNNNWTRRIQETGQFLINVMSPTPDLWRDNKSSLSSGEFGARVARRVRLTHAAIRWMLEAPEKIQYQSALFPDPDEELTSWQVRLRKAGLDDSLDDKPLNQQDLLATLGTFTTVVLRALELLAVPYTDEDRDALHFLWNIVAWHLGIGDRATLAAAGIEPHSEAWTGSALLPIDPDEMDGTYDHLASHLQGPTDAGRRMAKALTQELAFPMPRRLQGVPAYIVRYLIGQQHADQLDIERGGYVELFLSHTALVEFWTKRARTGVVGRFSIGLLSKNVTRFALRAFITQARWSERGLTIDPRIAGKWGIQIPPEPRTTART